MFKHFILFLIEKYLEKQNIKRRNKYYGGNDFIIVNEDGSKIINPKPNKFKKIKIIVKDGAKNNKVIIHKPFCVKAFLKINLTKNNSIVEIKKNSEIKKLIIWTSNNTKTLIGENFYSDNATINQNFSSGTSLTIEDDCIVSYGVLIRTSDAHTVFDLDNKKISNIPKSILIGKHCWICANTTILKGVKLPKNTIVATCALVNKSFEKENTIVAGVPCKIVKENIGWNKTKPDIYALENQ